MNQKEIGIYVHIPFCKQKCNYCDFYSCSQMEEWALRYTKSVIKEIENESIKQKNSIVKTIYIGGGTPSFIDSKFIVQILNSINEKYNVDKNAEITIEVNPRNSNN